MPPPGAGEGWFAKAPRGKLSPGPEYKYALELAKSHPQRSTEDKQPTEQILSHEDRLTAKGILSQFIQKKEIEMPEDLAKWVFGSMDCPPELKKIRDLGFNESVELARECMESQNDKQAAKWAKDMVLAAGQITNGPHTYDEKRDIFVPIHQVR